MWKMDNFRRLNGLIDGPGHPSYHAFELFDTLLFFRAFVALTHKTPTPANETDMHEKFNVETFAVISNRFHEPSIAIQRRNLCRQKRRRDK
jgi:hypothetical protein